LKSVLKEEKQNYSLLKQQHVGGGEYFDNTILPFHWNDHFVSWKANEINFIQ
jgi:hypothetical protein